MKKVKYEKPNLIELKKLAPAEADDCGENGSSASNSCYDHGSVASENCVGNGTDAAGTCTGEGANTV